MYGRSAMKSLAQLPSSSMRVAEVGLGLGRGGGGSSSEGGSSVGGGNRSSGGDNGGSGRAAARRRQQRSGDGSSGDGGGGSGSGSYPLESVGGGTQQQGTALRLLSLFLVRWLPLAWVALPLEDMSPAGYRAVRLARLAQGAAERRGRAGSGVLGTAAL